jgi:hypothetical protein
MWLLLVNPKIVDLRVPVHLLLFSLSTSVAGAVETVEPPQHV